VTKIRFQCAHCGKPVVVSEEFAGKKGKCPACKGMIEVPTASSMPPPTSAPATTPIPAKVLAPVQTPVPFEGLWKVQPTEKKASQASTPFWLFRAGRLTISYVGQSYDQRFQCRMAESSGLPELNVAPCDTQSGAAVQEIKTVLAQYSGPFELAGDVLTIHPKKGDQALVLRRVPKSITYYTQSEIRDLIDATNPHALAASFKRLAVLHKEGHPNIVPTLNLFLATCDAENQVDLVGATFRALDITCADLMVASLEASWDSFDNEWKPLNSIYHTFFARVHWLGRRGDVRALKFIFPPWDESAMYSEQVEKMAANLLTTKAADVPAAWLRSLSELRLWKYAGNAEKKAELDWDPSWGPPPRIATLQPSETIRTLAKNILAERPAPVPKKK
jgi:hypothetical protein